MNWDTPTESQEQNKTSQNVVTALFGTMLAGKNKPSFSVELIKATAVNASENNIAFPVSQIAREKRHNIFMKSQIY